MNTERYLATTLRDFLNEGSDDTDRYTIDDNFYLYKDGRRVVNS